MSVIGSNVLAGASGQGGGYNLTNSLRFRSSASAYLNRTFSTPTSRRIFTTSFWIKRGEFAGDFIYGRGTGPESYIAWSSNSLEFYDYTAPSYNFRLVTSQVFRDPAAWYHIVVAVDTTQATNTNRIKIYVNGSQVTAFSTANYPAQNFDSNLNTNSTVNIGRADFGDYLDGYLTEFNFVDGQQLTPSSFGETSTTTGVWIPKKYTGTYGTNGFYLPFTDNSALTTSSNVGLGKDFSGNSNYWTTNNISITSGSTYDSMTDVPTLTSATAANYCTWNPLVWRTAASLATFTDGNLKATGSSVYTWATQALPTTGKFYCELTATAGSSVAGVGLCTLTLQNSVYTNETQYLTNGNKSINGTDTAYGSSYTTGDVIGIAADVDAGTVTFYKNNVSQGAISGSYAGTFFFALYGGSWAFSINCGQRPFTYTPPTGFVALNTFNLPTPTIGATASTTANKYMDATTYSGTGNSGQTITNAGGFQPDLVWTKARSTTYNNILYDSVRGTGTTKSLYSDDTAAEGAYSTFTNLSSFNSNGWTIGSTSGNNAMNASGQTFVAWQWRASNATAVTNTAGSITSTVSANTTAGFSVVTFTTQSSGTATVGHGLGVAPSMIITKLRTDASNWNVFHSSVGNTGILNLNTTGATTTNSQYWNNTSPTSSVFTTGTWYTGSLTAVAYCFAPVAGYSAMGSYTGNGSSDGVFVFTGFRPKYVLIKRTDSADHWTVQDAVREPSNVSGLRLYPNQSVAEDGSPSSTAYIDILSNGFKIRTSDSQKNANGGTYIYYAVAENPFKYSNAR